jgi:hypothetical protein
MVAQAFAVPGSYVSHGCFLLLCRFDFPERLHPMLHHELKVGAVGGDFSDGFSFGPGCAAIKRRRAAVGASTSVSSATLAAKVTMSSGFRMHSSSSSRSEG